MTSEAVALRAPTVQKLLVRNDRMGWKDKEAVEDELKRAGTTLDALLKFRSPFGNCVLYFALEANNAGAFQFMLKQGADPDACNKDGETCLLRAARRGEKTTALRLLEAKARVDFRDKLGNSALHWAATCGHKDLITLLLDHGANIDAINNVRAAVLCAALSPRLILSAGSKGRPR